RRSPIAFLPSRSMTVPPVLILPCLSTFTSAESTWRPDVSIDETRFADVVVVVRADANERNETIALTPHVAGNSRGQDPREPRRSDVAAGELANCVASPNSQRRMAAGPGLVCKGPLHA